MKRMHAFQRRTEKWISFQTDKINASVGAVILFEQEYEKKGTYWGAFFLA